MELKAAGVPKWNCITKYARTQVLNSVPAKTFLSPSKSGISVFKFDFAFFRMADEVHLLSEQTKSWNLLSGPYLTN